MDQFYQSQDSVSDPARSVLSVVPSDQAPLPMIPKAIFVGAGGDVALRAVDDTQVVTFRNVPDGSILPVRAIEIRATGTTADALVLLI